MKVIEVTHPIQKEQLINEDVAMAFGFFDGMHRGHDKVFQTLDRKAKESNLKKAVMIHPSVVLNPERKRTTYLTPLSDKLEMIAQHDIDYCIVINFSSRFANVTSEAFIQEYVINNHVKEVIAGFDFTFGKFGKGNMTVLQESEEFNTTIVGKQEMGSEKISTTAIREALTEGNLRKANEALGYLYRIKGTVVQGENVAERLVSHSNVQPNDDYVLPKKVSMP